MASSNRRAANSSGPAVSSSLAKRPAMADIPAKVPAMAPSEQAKKRVALANVTNQSNTSRGPSRIVGKVVNVKSNTSKSGLKKAPITTSNRITNSRRNSLSSSSSLKPNYTNKSTPITTRKTVPKKELPIIEKDNKLPPGVTVRLVPCRSTLKSPGQSGDSVSVGETMSTCGSMKSPDFEYVDNADSSVLASLEKRTNINLRISEDNHNNNNSNNNDDSMEIDEKVIEVDKDYEDPQMCAALACDIYKYLRLAETKKRPSTDFMETIQTDINASMRAILVDWLVEVAEEYRLVPDTLYLTINYIDRYLSGNEINRQRLQLLGVACMLIASKYEEICAPQVEEFCYITDNTYFKEEVLQMESSVLNYLKFEMTAPTAKCFLRRFVRAAHSSDEVSSSSYYQLEFLASYVAELSLLEYNLLCYSPSLIAASSIFLAKFILQPTKNPWNTTLCHYTLYKPSELCDCVKALHRLFCIGPGSNLPAIREKYSQHKYKFVAKKNCPSTIPSEYFKDAIN